MNWLKDKLITIFIVVAIIAMALTGFPVILGTLLLIGVTTLMMTADDAGYNNSNLSVRRISIPRSFEIEELYRALRFQPFGALGNVRMAGMKLIRGPVLILETPEIPVYYYIYKGRFGTKLYVGEAYIKQYIKNDQPPQPAEDGQEQPFDSSQVLDMLYCACCNYVQTGAVSFVPTAQMEAERDNDPPAAVQTLTKWSRAIDASLFCGTIRSVAGIVIGMLALAGASLDFTNEYVDGIFAIFILILLLVSPLIILSGIIRQLRDLIPTRKSPDEE